MNREFHESFDKATLRSLRRKLLSWYRANARSLPWRATDDPYHIWVSEIMLQQTRVETVLRYYDRFLERFPSVEVLAAASERELLVTWEGLGYYRRARNLHKAAKLVVQTRNGELPTSAEEWCELSGIGRYTAAAIASITRSEAAAVLDGNVKRVLARLHGIEGAIDQSATEKLLWQQAEELLNPRHPGDHNQAMMELGANICLPKSPKCDRCPIAEFCSARASGQQEQLPNRSPRKAIPTRRSLALLLRRERDGALFIRRIEGDLLTGMWEFPQEWIKETESDEEAFLRASRAWLGNKTVMPVSSITATHTYTHFKLDATGQIVNLNVQDERKVEQRLKFSSSDNSSDSSSDSFSWLTPKNRDQFPIHRAHQKLLEQLHALYHPHS